MARIILYGYILLLCISNIYSQFDVNIEPKKNKVVENPASTKEEVKDAPPVPAFKIDIGNEEKKKDGISSSTTSTSKAITNSSNIKSKANEEIESGAVMRGVFVFVGITLLFIIYIAFKTYRRGNKRNVLVKKYGVRTRRTDLEMAPLPLDDDEEDETVFDLGSVNNR